MARTELTWGASMRLCFDALASRATQQRSKSAMLPALASSGGLRHRGATSTILAAFLLLGLVLVCTMVAAGPIELEVFAGGASSDSATATPTLVSTPTSSTPLPLTKERAKALIDQEIVPQIVPAAPSSITRLSWGSSLRVHELGTILTPTQVREQPRLNYNIHANRFYTVMLIDPDAPSRSEPVFGQWMHWLVVNVPGRDLSRGDTLVEYVGAAPPEGSGKHRYIFLIFEQSKRMSVEAQVHISRFTGTGRSKWSAERFMANNDGGQKLISLNYFLAEFDESVTGIYRQLLA